jgi:hypothetical protein
MAEVGTGLPSTSTRMSPGLTHFGRAVPHYARDQHALVVGELE